MELKIKEARLSAGLTQTELARRMQASLPAVSAWELGTRQISIEKLRLLADILGCSCAYLLGEDVQTSQAEALDRAVLPTMNGMPVWVGGCGWGLVDANARQILFVGKKPLPFTDAPADIRCIPPAFSLSMAGVGPPLDMDGILNRETVWVEPISCDDKLRDELRGWYRPHDNRLVQNEFGARFYLDTYGAKWLAFESCL